MNKQTAEQIIEKHIGELDWPEFKEFGFLRKTLKAMEEYATQQPLPVKGEAQEVRLITALMQGKELRQYHDKENYLSLWVERVQGQVYFYQNGWGSAFGKAEDKVSDVLKNPHQWTVGPSAVECEAAEWVAMVAAEAERRASQHNYTTWQHDAKWFRRGAKWEHERSASQLSAARKEIEELKKTIEAFKTKSEKMEKRWRKAESENGGLYGKIEQLQQRIKELEGAEAQSKIWYKAYEDQVRAVRRLHDIEQQLYEKIADLESKLGSHGGY